MTPLQELIGGGHKVQLKAKTGEWLMTKELGDSSTPGKATLCQRSLPSRHDEWKVAQPWGSEGVASSAIQAVVLGKLLFPQRLQLSHRTRHKASPEGPEELMRSHTDRYELSHSGAKGWLRVYFSEVWSCLSL